MPPPNLKQLTARIAPRSVFFIYALHGTGGEESSSTRSTTPPRTEADLGDPGGVAHRGITARPKEYERRVIGFFDDALARALALT
jgi:hypothetical protein